MENAVGYDSTLHQQKQKQKQTQMHNTLPADLDKQAWINNLLAVYLTSQKPCALLPWAHVIIMYVIGCQVPGCHSQRIIL